MKPLLFLSQRIPFPPNKGDKLRSFSVLRHLSKSWKIHLGCFIDDPADWQYLDDVRAFCVDVCCVGLDKRWAKVRSLAGLATGTSLSEPYFRNRHLSAWVDTVLSDVKPSAAFLFSSVMGQYIPWQDGKRPKRVVMDFVDVDSVKWRQYADMHGFPMSWIYRRESRMLLDFDRRVARNADASVFVSAPEAALFRSLAPETADRTFDISNGIDFQYFAATDQHDNPFAAGLKSIVFTGAMDYWPNIDAACWFARDIYPKVRDRVPDAQFFVVGGNPDAKVLRLKELAGVTVTGRVADVRPYLAHATVAVAPMRVARGIQNKVLEGMAMGRVVVTTDQGLEGIDARPGLDLLVANDIEGLVNQTVRALVDSSLTGMGQEARRRIETRYDWTAKLARMEALLGAGGQGEGRPG
jgi:sugar transferase (PEP-CTERM/EpsH1 system associated)